MSDAILLFVVLNVCEFGLLITFEYGVCPWYHTLPGVMVPAIMHSECQPDCDRRESSHSTNIQMMAKRRGERSNHINFVRSDDLAVGTAISFQCRDDEWL